jgi:PPK2 family polyphosphate:nucleotide phosphotransferase
MIKKRILRKLIVKHGKDISLADYETDWAMNEELKTGGEEGVKDQAAQILEVNRASLAEAQELLWASDTYSILIILQGIDASGKDGIIKHVMSGVNPQGCSVHAFKVPSPEELDHDYLWRYSKELPPRGEIGIFNRSYYEDVLVVMVHPELLEAQHLPPGKRGNRFWEDRYEDINAFEKHLFLNGTQILKFFLNISKEEQRKRLLERLDNKDKLWKFSPADAKERSYWGDYVNAYETMLNTTSTKYAPWYIIPANHKWAARALVAEIFANKIQALDLQYPKISEQQTQEMDAAREELSHE